MNCIRAFIRRYLDQEAFRDDDESFLYLMLLSSVALAFFIHTVFLLFFLWRAVIPAMMWTNCGYLLICAIQFLLLRHRRYTASGVLLSVQSGAYVFLSCRFLGSGSGIAFYWLTVMVLQVYIPYARLRVRAAVAFAVWLAMLAPLFAGTEPLRAVPQRCLVCIYLLNATFAFICIIVQLVFSDLIRSTARQENQSRMDDLQSQAYTDPLTSLFNRRYAEHLFERLRRELPRRKWCMALLDVDDFKCVNDTYGHCVGDQALIHLADYIQACLRKTDVVIRWGGEEFLLLLADVEPAMGRVVLDELRCSIACRHLDVDGARVAFTVTIGMAELNLADVQESIARCDKNLYDGKRFGKNRVVYRQAAD